MIGPGITILGISVGTIELTEVDAVEAVVVDVIVEFEGGFKK